MDEFVYSADNIPQMRKSQIETLMDEDNENDDDMVEDLGGNNAVNFSNLDSLFRAANLARSQWRTIDAANSLNLGVCGVLATL